MPGQDQPIRNVDGTALYPVLTKREYLAGLVLQGLLSNPKIAQRNHGEYGEITTSGLCIEAVSLADRLLIQLEK